LRRKPKGGYLNIEKSLLQGRLTLERAQKMEYLSKTKTAVSRLTTLPNKYDLMPHQELSVGYWLLNPIFYLGHGAGLGKTLIAASTLNYLLEEKLKLYLMQNGFPLEEIHYWIRNEVFKKEDFWSVGKIGAFLAKNKGKNTQFYTLSKKVIFAGKKDSLKQVQREFEENTQLRTKIISSGEKGILKALSNLDYAMTDVILTNHNSLKQKNFIEFYNANYEDFDTFILDDCESIKSYKTQIAKKVIDFVDDASRVLFMNANPLDNSPEDFYVQLDILNSDLMPTKDAFLKEFAIPDETAGHWKTNSAGERTFIRHRGVYKGYKNQDRLLDYIKFHYYGITKQKLAQEAGLNHKKKYIELELLDALPIQEKEVKSWNYQEIYNNPVDLISIEDWDKLPKLKRLQEFTIDLHKSNKKVYIYIWFKRPQYELQKMLAEVGIESIVINGDTRNTAEEIDKFNNGDVDVVISNIARAVSFYNTHHQIFYSIPTNPSVLEQVMQRIDRLDFKNEKYYTFLFYGKNALKHYELNAVKRLLHGREKASNTFLRRDRNVIAQLLEKIEKEVNLNV